MEANNLFGNFFLARATSFYPSQSLVEASATVFPREFRLGQLHTLQQLNSPLSVIWALELTLHYLQMF